MGGFGIRLLVGLVGAGIGMLTYRLALRLVRDRLVACGLTAPRSPASTRCGRSGRCCIGVLFLLVLLWTVEVPDSFVGRHPMVVVPVLMWLWANIHGTFALGFAYLGLHLLGRWLDGAPPWDGRERALLFGARRSRSRRCSSTRTASALVTFPIELLSRGDILSHIVEWKSPDFRQAWGVALGIWIVVFVVALARGRHRVTRRDLVVAVPMLAARAVGAAQRRRSRRSSACRSSPGPSPATRRSRRSCAARWSAAAITVLVLAARDDGLPGQHREELRLRHVSGRARCATSSATTSWASTC